LGTFFGYATGNTYDRPVHAGWTICPALFGHVDYHSHNGYRDRVVENSWIDGYSYYKHKGRPIITVNVLEDNAVRKQLRVVATFVGYGGAGLDDHYDIDHKKDRAFTCYADGSVFIKDVDVIDTYDLPSGGTGEGKYTFIHATVNSLVRTNNASVPERNLFTSQFGTMNPRTVEDGWYKPVQPWVCQFGGPQTWMNYLLTVYSADQNQFDSMRMHCLHYCVRAGWAWGPLGPGFPKTRNCTTALRSIGSPKKIILSRHSDSIDLWNLSTWAFKFGLFGGRGTGSTPSVSNIFWKAGENLPSRSSNT